MAPRPDADAALRAWAAAHARSAGRSGTAAVSWSDNPYRLVRTLFVDQGIGELPVSVAWSSDRERPRLVARGEVTQIWGQTDSSLRTATSEGIWRLDIPHIDNTQVVSRWLERDPVVLSNDLWNGCSVAYPDSGSFVELSSAILAMAWWRGPTSGLLAYSTRDGNTHISSVNFPHLVFRAFDPGEEPVQLLGWLPGADSPRLVRAFGDSTIQIRDVSRLEWQQVLYEPDLSTFACSPDPRRASLAVARSNGEVVLYDVDHPSSGPLRALSVPSGNLVTSLAWSPDPAQPLLAAGFFDGPARVWDPDTGRCVAVLEHPAKVTSVALTVDRLGRSLLATGCLDGRARIWIADAPATKRATGTARNTAGAQFTVTDRTPPLIRAAGADTVGTATWMSVPRGRLLTAEPNPDASGYRVHTWDNDTGRPEDFLTTTDTGTEPMMMACATGRSGLVIATVTPRGGTLIVDVWGLYYITPEREHRFLLSRPVGQAVYGVQVAVSDYTSQLLAVVRVPRRTAGSEKASGSYIDVFDLDKRQAVLRHHVKWEVRATAWSRHSKDSQQLALGGTGGELFIVDPRGISPREFHMQGSATAITWCTTTRGDLQHLTLAVATSGSGSGPGAVHLCEPTTGAIVRTLPHPDPIVSMTSGIQGDRAGSNTLFTLTTAGVLRIWETTSGELVETNYSAIPAVRLESNKSEWLPLWGYLRLAVNTVEGLRVYDITPTSLSRTSRTSQPSQHPVPEPTPSLPLSVSHDFLALGAGGLWAPLGLVADALTLVGGRHGRLHDSRLEVLSGHPGVARLRSLGWPARARGGLAALLVAGQDGAEHAAPAQTTSAEQLELLVHALETEPIKPTTAPAALQSLTGAADAVTDKTLTLLRILGPDAVAADPLLPVRLAGRVPELPELPPRHTALLEGGRALHSPDDTARASGPRFTPGTVGISRHGPLHTVLPTQLALPDQLRMIRYARGELLHRTHPAHRPPPTGAVTMILDTTPATYGRCEAVLRLAAHLITAALWRAGRSPSLVTLTDPGLARELTRPEDLLTVWTSRTLTPPDFGRALQTAADTANSAGSTDTTASTDAANDIVIILTNSHAVREQFTTGHITLGPRHHLLTAHTPTSTPPPPPAHPNHHQVSTTVGTDQLIAHLFAMLAQDAEASGAVR